MKRSGLTPSGTPPRPRRAGSPAPPGCDASFLPISARAAFPTPRRSRPRRRLPSAGAWRWPTTSTPSNFEQPTGVLVALVLYSTERRKGQEAEQVSDHPTGTVTFLFTDIQGSTAMWERDADAMRLALARHDAILRRLIERHGGNVFKLMGDACCAA